MKKLTLPPVFVFKKTDGLGKPKVFRLPNSTEEIRSMLLACVTVLARHSKVPCRIGQVTVHLTDEWVRDPTAPEKEWGGMAWCDDNLIRVRVYPEFHKTLTVIIHEYLHLCGYMKEWVVSTLTNRFKPEIADIASILLAGYYKGAAYLAHANEGMAYQPDGTDLDSYNDQQWARTKVVWTRKYRKKGRGVKVVGVPDIFED